MPNPYQLQMAYNPNYIGDNETVDGYNMDFTTKLEKLFADFPKMYQGAEVQTVFFDPESDSDSDIKSVKKSDMESDMEFDVESKKSVMKSNMVSNLESDVESEEDTESEDTESEDTESEDTESEDTESKKDTESEDTESKKDTESKMSINSFMVPVNNISNFIQPIDDTFTSFKVNVDNTKPKLSILNFIR